MKRPKSRPQEVSSREGRHSDLDVEAGLGAPGARFLAGTLKWCSVENEEIPRFKFQGAQTETHGNPPI